MIGSVLRFAFKQLSKRRLPIVNGKLTVSGLHDEVEIIRDKWGVPHIRAKTDYDLFFAQGFVHAQDRLWQLEQNKRVAKGQLSEIIGDLALDTDRTALTFGFARSGKADWELLGDEIKRALTAYADGINAYMRHPTSKLPLEFTLLRFKPELWTPEDSLAISRLMVWQLSHAWYGEIIKSKIIEKIGEKHAKELEFIYPEDNPATLPTGIEFNLLNIDKSLTGMKGPFISKGKGSNSWVVSGKLSKTGGAYLCNDMHLKISLPSIWYENHLKSKSIHASGVTLPGVPLIQVGHNNHIAWGMTLAFVDSEDLYIEKLNPENDAQVEYNGKWEAIKILKEEITVKGQKEPYIEEIKITRNGPIISKVVSGHNEVLSVKSLALQPTRSFEGWYKLNCASNWDDFVSSIKLIDAAQLNVTYADTEGNIGYYVSGKVPIRKKGKGDVPTPGWTSEYEWTGTVPFEEMPHAFNPKQGYLVTCNHKIVDDDFPYFLGNVWMNGYRAKRFDDIMNTMDKVGIEDFKKMQLDFLCPPALEMKRILADYKSPNTENQILLDYFFGWNGVLSPDTIGGTIYEILRYFVLKTILEPGLGKELTTIYMGTGFHPILYHSHEFYGHDTPLLLRLLKNPESWWITNAGGYESVLEEGLKQTLSWLHSHFGEKPQNWQWGKLHTVTFTHAMSIQKPLDKVFDRGPVAIGGDTDTLCQTAIAPDDPFEVKTWAPSHRQIIDMRNLSNSLIDHPPGQSGQLASPHYDDLINSWLNGEYHPMLWTDDQLEVYMKSKLILSPIKGVH
ncbi:MAG: penicillin acylase family protein [Candidatus Heimdallarchaeota archaeon]|nr:penicillin acylase family protein [Candidatus Heimdallarchaeota archaeon]